MDGGGKIAYLDMARSEFFGGDDDCCSLAKGGGRFCLLGFRLLV